MKNFIYALRYLLKSKGGNITRMVSLTLGLLVGLLVFSYVTYNLSFDRFLPGRDRIYQVWVNYNYEGFKGDYKWQVAPMAPALAAEIPQVEAATRTSQIFTYEFVYGEDIFPAKSMGVDTCFFDVLDYGIVSGNPHDIFATTGAVMVSESYATKVFGEKNPIDEILHIGESLYTVKGIFRDIPKNSQIGEFDLMYGFGWRNRVSWHGGDSFPTYVKLRKGATLEEVEPLFREVIEKHQAGADDEDELEGESEYYMVPIAKAFTHDTDIPRVALIISLLGLLTLFIACMNYILVSISMLADRGKTMAMLKCNGASGRDISAISLWETAIIIIISLLAAALIIMMLHVPIESVTGVSVSSLFAPERIWVPALIILAVFCTAGFIPARLFAVVPVNTAFRGKVNGRSGWKKALLAIEIIAVTAVIVFLLVANRQYRYMLDVDRGFDHSNLITVNLYGQQSTWETYTYELEQIPGVVSVSYASEIPYRWMQGDYTMSDDGSTVLFSARIIDIAHGYLETMGIKIAEGRAHNLTDSPDKVVVNREYVRLRGWEEGNAVGKTHLRDPDAGSTVYTIVGVTDDYWIGDTGEILPLVMFRPDENREEWFDTGRYTFVLKVNATTPQIIDAVRDKIAEFYPYDAPEVLTYDTILAHIMENEKTFRNTIAAISVIALFIALMGLIGYLNDEIRQRRKEIAIRKVNGAGRNDIIKLIARDCAIIAIPSVIAGAGVACLLAVNWQKSFPHKAPLSLAIFVGGALLVIAIIYTIELIKTWKIASSNPVDMINRE